MKHTSRAWSAVILPIALLLISCSEDTGSLGIASEQDALSTSTAAFGILSNDMLNTIVPASSTACYLGKVIDPEIDEAITATFAAQFHTFENYTFPDEANIIPDDEGLLCQSIEIRLYIKSTFGDKNNPMKLEVLPLSMNEGKILQESDKLYTNTDLSQLVDESQEPIATKVFTSTDYNLSEEERADKNYLSNVRIVLDNKFGDNIMRKFYSNPEFFRDSYSFIRNVCAGFLFRTVGGTGTMLNIEVCTLNLNFKFKNATDPNTTLEGLCRFAATPEVIQSTQFESSNLNSLIGKEDYTMLKTPAGICTELILPIDEIYKGHENDSIIRTSFTLTRINNQDEDALDDNYAFGIPKNLLLVRKQNLNTFFESHQVSDSRQSYTSTYNELYNCYTYENISRLITICQREKETSMAAEIDGYREDCKSIFKDENGLTEITGSWKTRFEQKWEEEYKPEWPNVWNANHPDWNHVILVPVTVATATDNTGNTTQVSVNQDMSLCSTKIVRGTAAKPIKMQVIYGRFASK